MPVLVAVVTAATMLVATLAFGWLAPAGVGAAVALAAVLVDRGVRRAVPHGRTPPVATLHTVIVRPARLAVAAVLVAWGLLLGRAMLGGSGRALVALVGGLAGVRGVPAALVTVVLALATLALGAALAWAGATIVAGVLGAVTASGPGRVTLSGTSDVDPARRAERAPAAQTP